MDLAVIFLIGLAASFFGSFMSGTTSLISITALYAMGLPSQVVLSTFRVGVFGFETGGILQYHKNKKIDWSVFVPLTVTSLMGAAIGAFIIVSIDETLIQKIVGYTILVFVPVLLLNPKMGIEKRDTSQTKRWGGHIANFLTTVWGASFVVGIGYMGVIKYMYFYGHTLLEAKASGKLPAVIGDIVVLAVFFYTGIINWPMGFSLLTGMFLGAFIGTHYAIKIGDGWLRKILLVTIALFSLKLILGL